MRKTTDDIIPALKLDNLSNKSPQKQQDTRNVNNEIRYSQSVAGSVPGGSILHSKTLDSETLSKYYNGMPAYLRSEGPFTTYNHHKAKGDTYHENSKLTKSQAKQRL